MNIFAQNAIIANLISLHFPESTKSRNNFATILKLVYLTLWMCYIFYPGVMGLLIFLNPTQAPFLGSMLNSKIFANCVTTTCQFPLFAKLLLAIFEWISFLFMEVPPFHCFVFNFLTGVIFLLEESLNSSKSQEIGYYRRLQILEKMVNASARARIFPCMASGMPIGQILNGFGSIRFHSTLNPAHLGFMVVFVVTVTVLSLIVFGGCGLIHERSLVWLRSARQRTCSRKASKIQRRVLRSLIPLRVWFGSNFVDNLTPLVIQHFCMVQTANLLLLSYKK